MKSVVLKGTRNGFEIALDDSENFETIKTEFTELLDQLVHSSDYSEKKGMKFDIITGNRIFFVDDWIR